MRKVVRTTTLLACVVLVVSCAKTSSPQELGEPAVQAFILRLEEKLSWGEWVLEDVHEVYSQTDLSNLRRYRTQIEPLVLAYLQEGTVTATLTAQYLKYPDALPILRELLLKFRTEPDVRAEGEDGQFYQYYPLSEAYIEALEKISGTSIHQAIQLTEVEKRRLQAAEASSVAIGHHSDRAEWLLERLAR